MDRYQLGLFRSVSLARGGNEISALCGFEFGNRSVPGCLTDDENSRIHSCECDLPCSIARSEKTVYIEPIVGRLQDGSQLPEIGIGGGAGDLYQVHELELPDQASLEELEKLCLERIHDSRVLSQTRDALFEAFRSKSKSLSLDNYGMKENTDIPLEKLVSILSRGHTDKRPSADVKDKAGNQLPNIIVSCHPAPLHSSPANKYSNFLTPATHRTTNYASWSLHSNPKISTLAQLTLSPGTKAARFRLFSATSVLGVASPTILICGG